MGNESSYFGFGSPQQQVHMQGQKTLSFSYNMHLFLPYLLNDSQTIQSAINFSKLLLCLTLICGDWSISFPFHNKSSVCERSAALCTALPGKPLFLPLQKRHPSSKEWICIFIQTSAKRPTSGLAIC